MTLAELISNKMPFLMLNFTIPVLSRHLAITCGWLLNTGLTVDLITQGSPFRELTKQIFFLGSAKFWQRNCIAKQRMERRRFEYSCALCVRFLQQSQNSCKHQNNSGSYVGYLVRGFIYWYLTTLTTYPKWRVIVC